MGVITLHALKTGLPVSINTDAISQVGTNVADETGGDGGYVLRIDGGSVEVREPYARIMAAWYEERGR